MRKSIKAARAAKLAATVTNEAPVTETVANVPAVLETVATETTTNETGLSVLDNAEQHNGVTLDNETGETVSDETTDDTGETVATPDAAIAKAERIAADRAAVKAIYASFDNALSIPVKPLSAFKLAPSSAHPNARGATQRQAAAIVVGLSAAGQPIADGVSFARAFEIDGRPVAIENGAARDMLASGLVTVSGATPASETFTLSRNAAKTIAGLLGSTLTKRVNKHAADCAKAAEAEAAAA